MGLKKWWQERRRMRSKQKVKSLLKDYQNGYLHSDDYYKRVIVQHYPPQKGQDLLTQKERFLREYSMREYEFRQACLRRNLLNQFECRYAQQIEEKVRFSGHKKWSAMVRQLQKSKTR